MAKSKKLQNKEFYDVETNMTASKISLYAASREELKGKVVRLDLTRSLRGRSFELRLRIDLEDNKLVGNPMTLELAGSYIRRMMRKGSDYVEDSFKAKSMDSEMVIKPFLITRHKVSRAVRNALRKTTKDMLIEHIKNRKSREIFTEVMTNKIQKDISVKLKKIYPLALCEIRVVDIISEIKE
jgi:ribosomal protein S3AE